MINLLVFIDSSAVNQGEKSNFKKEVCSILYTPPHHGEEKKAALLKNEWYKNSQ